MKLYAYISGNPMTKPHQVKVEFYPVFQEGDCFGVYSPRGFANETDNVYITPDGQERAGEWLSQFNNDVNAWESIETLTKQQAAQRNYRHGQSPIPVEYLGIFYAGGKIERGQTMSPDELRDVFGAEIVTAALLTEVTRWEAKEKQMFGQPESVANINAIGAEIIAEWGGVRK